MAAYRGIVRGKVIELAEPADLPDGAEVEVWLAAPPPASLEERQHERAFLERLLELGMIASIPSRAPDPPGTDRSLIPVEGPLVSQTIIEERR